MTDLIQYNHCGDWKVRKYKREVFHDNLWNEDPILMESRGHVLDQNDELIANPLRKLFNYKENGTEVPLNERIIAVEKVNGFMFHVTKHRDFIVQGTTGSLDSPFVTLAKENMERHNVNYDGFEYLRLSFGTVTCVFEIKDNVNDPHIVEGEEDGVYLLAMREVETGRMLAQPVLDKAAVHLNVKRPKWKICSFETALQEVQTVKHEGFVIYDLKTAEGLLKLKGPYYISKKSIMRKHPSTVFNNDYRTLVDEEYYPIIEKIRELYTAERWATLNEQQKGFVFWKIYQASIMTTGDKIKHITNHPGLSWCIEHDDLSISYDYDSEYFIAKLKYYSVAYTELRLSQIGEFRTTGDTIDEAISEMYIKVFIQLGDYDYLTDGTLRYRSHQAYFEHLSKKLDLAKLNVVQDIEYYGKS